MTTKALNMLTLIALAFTTNCKSQNDDGSKKGLFVDERDGTEYKWVKMKDGKTWMATNLEYDAENSECYEGENGYCQKFGRLYLWSDIDSICPNGWRVPTDMEWWNMITQEMKPYKDSEMYPMGKTTSDPRLRELTNDSLGLQLKYGGMKEPEYGFLNIKGMGYYWTSSGHKEEPMLAWYYGVDGNNQTDLKQENKIVRVATSKEMKFSCRCIKIDE